MKIFYAADTTANSFFESNIWRNNLYMPLVEMGNDVEEFQYDLRQTYQNVDPTDSAQKRFIKKNRPSVTAALLRQLKKSHAKKPIDLFFSYFYDACILPEALDEIRSWGIKTMNWYCNGSYQLHLVSEISPHYDWCLVPEKFRIPDYTQMGARPLYCQEAANPAIYKPYPVEQAYEVTFVGQAYGDRPAYIKYLLDQKIDVRVWGYAWQNYSQATRQSAKSSLLTKALRASKKMMTTSGRQQIRRRLSQLKIQNSTAPSIELPPQILGSVLSDLEMVQTFSRSKINLGFSTCGNSHLTEQRIVQVRLRDFEIPMSGGFYMVEHMQELEEFFEIGKEIVCYSSPEDLADKIKYYLSHDTQRARIAAAGRQRCLKDHTWHRRLSMAFQQAGLTP